MKAGLLQGAVALTLWAGSAMAQPALPPALPQVRILGTGGTIAGRENAAGTSYRSGAVPIGQLIGALPGVETIATLSAEQIANIPSGNMDETIWRTLLARTQAALGDDAVSGVVITHGTDTLEETAYFLSLLLPAAKPVVLVGSMRPSTAVSADGPQNMMDAVRVAAAPAATGRGVMVVMNDSIFDALAVTKIDVRRVDAFGAPARGPIGDVLQPVPRFTIGAAPAPAPFTLGDAPLPKVAIVYAYAGLTGADVLRSAEGARGVVIAGVGAGGFSASARDAVRDLVRRGVAVVRTPRQGFGDIWPGDPPAAGASDPEDSVRTIAGRELTPAKARILLMLALQQARPIEQLQAIFNSYGTSRR